MKTLFCNAGPGMNPKSRYIILLILMVLQFTAARAQSKQYVLQAGASLSNITPFLEGGIVGNFGVPPQAKYIHDELFAKSLVLDDGQQQIAIVIVDNLQISREVFDYARQLIQEKTGMKKENILLAATHTHSSVSASGVDDQRMNFNYARPLDEYQTFVAKRIADGVRRAIYQKEPAKIGWGSVQVPQHVFNRRWIMKEGADVPNPFGGQDKARMNPGVGNPDLVRPAGPTDPELYFVSVQALDGRPIGLLANYSLHYVGGVPADHISSDYFGAFAGYFTKLVEADKNVAGFVAMMSNGTSGNINNINFRGPAEKMSSYQKMQIVAKDVAEAAYKGSKGLTYKTDVKLGAVYSELNLEVRKPTPAMLARAKEVLANPDKMKHYHQQEPTYAKRIIQIQENWPDKIDVVMQTLQIGDLGIAAIPFETFAETGLEIKAKSPFKSTFVIELANGSYGYLPTPEQHELGGYETWLGTNRVEKQGSAKITKRLLEQFNQMKK
ncbi:neutral/alkaline non-lysosomal ceramidase N-terminal domain-containing protein [Dyadobacter sp. CY323]|uniref:neutral/alkaline non-lysosomal ceramidase N-terminal domain-containing protein n=1 Tax=Dyadobacter sp. CY323 TaxID=2907302 RepID=UPI001F1D2B93|nr:neutral/alkaline non-lysosomal ceramidase N-terminal domain-containing protein [Dyadobacter sp. CY323]MCE6991998.1 neutral/alkaline non-lysosomal ceramidase N-terminal domain-containing protein [Dyadobacter sp. CY323]